MAQAESRKKRRFSDYPQMNFRVSSEDLQELTASIKSVQETLNGNRDSDDLMYSKGDVACLALRHGLEWLRTQKGKLE